MEVPREGRQYTLADVARACGCTTDNVRALLKRGRVPEDAAPVIDPVTGSRIWSADRFRRFIDWNAARKAAETLERVTEPEEE